MKKIYLLFSVFTLLFINNCNDNPSDNIINSDSGWKVDIYTTLYDESADQWDNSSKYLNETYYYDGETYSPEYDYHSFFSGSYLLNSYPDSQKNKLGKLIKNDYFLSNGDIIFSDNYKYDNQNYLIECIFNDYDDNSLNKYIIEHDKGKLRKINVYNSNDVLLTFMIFEYNVNGLISNYSIFNSDSSLFITQKYIYDTNNFLIESIIEGIEDVKYNYSYNNRGLLAELIYYENDFMIEKIIFEYDSNDNLILQENIPLTNRNEYSYDNNNFLTEIIITIFEDNPRKYKMELKYNKE